MNCLHTMRLIVAICFLTSIGGVQPAHSAEAETPSARPNILFILLDNIGKDWSAILTHIKVGDTPDNKGQELTAREQFAGMAQYADKLVGRMVTALDELGIRENTIIVLTTDNGTDGGNYHGYENLGGRVSGKESAIGSTMRPKEDGYYPLTDLGINMPFIVNCPKLIPGGRESDDLIDMTDLLPTLADFAGADLPKNVIIDGRSLAPRLRNPADKSPWRSWCLSQYHERRVIRDQRFKLFSNGPFFDLSEDPLEQHDLQKSSRLSEDKETRDAHDKLTKVLDGLPVNAKLPWEFRSISARQLQAAKAKQK